MPSIRVVRSLVLLTSLVVEADARSQSIDPAGAQLTLHQPFALRLLVRMDTPVNGTHAAACIDADFQNGHTLLVSDRMQMTLTPAGRPGWQEVLFQHPHVVDDPVVLARIALRCPARFEREFVLEAIPGIPTEAAPPRAVPAKTRPTAIAAAPTIATARATRPEQITANQTPHSAAKAEPSITITTDSNPRPTTLTPPQQHQDAGNAEQLALQAENRRLRRELAEARQSKPLASTSRTAGDDPSWQHAATLGLALPLLGLLPLLRRWRGSRMPSIKSMDISLPTHPQDPGVRLAPTTAPGVPAAAARPFSRGPARDAVAAPAPAAPVVSPIGELSTALIPPTVIPAGGASLADPDAAVFTCQVDKLVQDGYVGVAITLLEKSLDAGPAKNPWLLLQLLALYERLGQRGDAARLISQLQTLYRVHLPMVGGQHVCGKALLDQPELLAEVSEAWRSPDLVQQLEGWLSATTGPTWDLATFEDLLLLHAIARNRPEEAPPVTTPDHTPHLEHVLEWTLDDH